MINKSLNFSAFLNISSCFKLFDTSSVYNRCHSFLKSRFISTASILRHERYSLYTSAHLILQHIRNLLHCFIKAQLYATDQGLCQTDTNKWIGWHHSERHIPYSDSTFPWQIKLNVSCELIIWPQSFKRFRMLPCSLSQKKGDLLRTRSQFLCTRMTSMN